MSFPHALSKAEENTKYRGKKPGPEVLILKESMAGFLLTPSSEDEIDAFDILNGCFPFRFQRTGCHSIHDVHAGSLWPCSATLST